MRQRKPFFALVFTLLVLLAVSSCLPKSPESGGGVNITLYGFSIMKESLEKEVIPAFSAKWKSEHGVDVRFTSSFAGSETITNQILQGVKAQIGIFSIERDAQRLKDKGFVTSDWRGLPQKGIINKTPFVRLCVPTVTRTSQLPHSYRCLILLGLNFRMTYLVLARIFR